MLTRALLLLLLTTAPAAALELSLPISCTFGTDCFIQQYVDRDPGSAVRDYACGDETYEGHQGTDIRLRATADVLRHVAVLAAAPGVVAGVRDGVPDHLVRSKEDAAAVEGRECGNGVLLDHGGGWQTEYCHMRQGSVAVKKGDRMPLGAKLGEVGYSGDAAFAHVHFQVMENGKIVDPFLADGKDDCGKDGPSLWSAAAKSALAYRAGDMLSMGFADHGIGLGELEIGAAERDPVAATPIVAYAWMINLEKGDLVDITLKRGDEVLAQNTGTLDHHKAQSLVFAGKKPPQGGWPKGAYVATLTVTRGGKPVLSDTRTLQLN